MPQRKRKEGQNLLTNCGGKEEKRKQGGKPKQTNSTTALGQRWGEKERTIVEKR